jgi:hypothetical protein
MTAPQQQTAQLELRDIHTPGEPDFWPPAPGWWLVALLLIAGLWLLGSRAWRHWRRLRRRRYVLAELDGLRGLPCGPELAAALSALLKRVALARFPRTDVAALSGTEWLAFLDRTGGNGRFRQGAGAVLAHGPYAPRLDCDTDTLIALARDWIKANL